MLTDASIQVYCVLIRKGFLKVNLFFWKFFHLCVPILNALINYVINY